MTLKTFRRMVEAFFRHWPIYLVIMLAIVGYGVMTLRSAEDRYTSSGTVFVESQSLVTAQSGVANPSAFTYLSAAQSTVAELRGLLQTDIFLASIVDRVDMDLAAGPSLSVDEVLRESPETDSSGDRYNLGSVSPPPDPAAWAEQAAALRESINIYPVSDNLMNVDVTDADPDLAHQLSIAIIEELIQFQITLDVAESAASEEFFLDLANDYEQDVLETRRAVDQELRRLGADRPEEEISSLDQRELDRLQEAEVLAVTRFRNALNEVEQSRLVSLQTQTDIQQSFSVFDPPRLPTEPDDSLVGELRVLLTAAATGLAIALAIPIVLGLIQRSVLFADDLDDVATVISVVPSARRSALRLSRRSEQSPAEPSEGAVHPLHDQATETLTYNAADLNIDPDAIDDPLVPTTAAEPEPAAAIPSSPSTELSSEEVAQALVEATSGTSPSSDTSGEPAGPIGAAQMLDALEHANSSQADANDHDDSTNGSESAQMSGRGPESSHDNGHADPTAAVENVGDERDAEEQHGDVTDLASRTETFDPTEVGATTATFTSLPPQPGTVDSSTPSLGVDPTGPPPPPLGDGLQQPANDPGAAVRTDGDDGQPFDPTVTAEISLGAGQTNAPPPPPAGRDPLPSTDDEVGDQGFKVQSRNGNGHQDDSSEDTTESNHAG